MMKRKSFLASLAALPAAIKALVAAEPEEVFDAADVGWSDPSGDFDSYIVHTDDCAQLISVYSDGFEVFWKGDEDVVRVRFTMERNGLKLGTVEQHGRSGRFYLAPHELQPGDWLHMRVMPYNYRGEEGFPMTFVGGMVR
jgi:hypothetical protein